MNEMNYGYAGKAALINLSSEEVQVLPITDDFKKKYVGGRGFIAHWLYEMVSAEVDPLSEESM